MRAPEVRGVVGHQLARMPSTVSVEELSVSSPVDTWTQLASILSIDELVVAGDALVRRVDPVTDLAGLRAAVDLAARRRGVRRLHVALDLVRAGTDSVAETRLRLMLRPIAGAQPVVGHRIVDAGRFIGTPDLAYVDAKLAIEYEGDVHRMDLRTFRNDIERRERFEDAGWRVIRVTGDHLHNPIALQNRVRRALAAR